MTEIRDRLLGGILMAEAPIFFLNVDSRGMIRESSRYASNLAGRALEGTPVESIFVDFTTPANLRGGGSPTGEAIRLNVNTSADLPQSLLFRFLPVEDGMLVLGWPDALELEDMRRQLVLLNNELSASTRSLHKSNAQLARLNELKNQFLGMAAHDLRRPVGIVLAYSEFLADETAGHLNDELTGFLGKIQSAAGSMKSIINDFLDVAVIESGRLTIKRSPQSIPALIEHILPMARIQARQNNVQIDVEIGEGIGLTPADGPKLEQALGNLISNAVEYTAPGTAIRITARREADQLVLSVKDRGPGIPDDLKSTLFQPFRPGTTRKTSKEKNSGLGLAITRMIVEAHGGRIWVESEAGAGAEFFISLPSHH